MPTTSILVWDPANILEPAQYPERAKTEAVALAASLNLAKGTVLGEISATPGTYGAYNPANSDGTEVARGILKFAVSTDSGGLITLTSTSSQAGGEWGEQVRSTPMYASGFFRTADLVGMDLGALEDLKAHLVEGDLTTGMLTF